jgi:hypothetical protein
LTMMFCGAALLAFAKWNAGNNCSRYTQPLCT